MADYSYSYGGVAVPELAFDVLKARAKDQDERSCAQTVLEILTFVLFGIAFLSVPFSEKFEAIGLNTFFVMPACFFGIVVSISAMNALAAKQRRPVVQHAKMSQNADGTIDVYIEDDPGFWCAVGCGLKEAYFMVGGMLTMKFDSGTGFTATQSLMVKKEHKQQVRSWLASAGVLKG